MTSHSSTALLSKRLAVLHGHLAAARDARLAVVPTAGAAVAVPPSDFLGFEELLGPEERQWRDKARAFAQNHVAPIIDKYYEKAEFPFELLPKLKELGIMGGTIKGYGCPGMSFMSAAMVVLELARVNSEFAGFFIIVTYLVMLSIEQCGSEEQKQKWLPRLASADAVGSFGLTEPGAGSDASGLQTTAKKVAGGWRLNGQKRWIGNATFADVIIIWARNEETGEVNGFLVEKGTKGLRTEKIENKMCFRCVQNADIYLEDCVVPESARFPNADSFLKGTAGILSASRIFVGWLPVGLAMGSYDAALKHLKERQQFGSPLAAFQLMQEKLVRMLANAQAMYLMSWRLSELFVKHGQVTRGQSSLVKAHNTLKGRECVALAREVLGGNGIIYDNVVARHFLDMEAAYTYEGTYEVNALVCGREITGIAAFKAPKNK
ncbi:acylCoA dehydrogenase domain containing protein [Acanthamoeba castellanii str. Neff]|uniref:AcylCoA dehydrogenase domain containing protein n=1 Tax=Acanthamoeba castellanii (strain ATCC 30010 / Neff) TaxID=1257118 RepID=L8GK01_ACACF|nr:acylCoA dehydrogenase domain containing protein [Acanthamoeba castellanii str. Neff]ELR13362.1 acylCoA dehydrogenase domain containing protein [Acanthamoeba castellanii str. Neff]